MQSALSRCSIAVCVDDKMELCRFCRDRAWLVSWNDQGHGEPRSQLTGRSISNGGSAGASPSLDFAFCRLPSSKPTSIFGDRMRPILSRFPIANCVDDKMELCRFCRDKIVFVSHGSTWKINGMGAYRDATGGLLNAPVGETSSLELPKNRHIYLCSLSQSEWPKASWNLLNRTESSWDRGKAFALIVCTHRRQVRELLANAESVQSSSPGLIAQRATPG